MAHRYHVGESLIPSIRHYMRYIDADEKLVNHGFVHKVNISNETRLRPDAHLPPSLAQQSNLLNSRRKDVRLPPWLLTKLRHVTKPEISSFFKTPIL